MTSYHMTVFANGHAFGLEDSSLAEYSMIVTIGLLLLVNATIIVRAGIMQGLRQSKLRNMKKKREIVMKERDEALKTLENHLEMKANRHFLDRETRRKTLANFTLQLDERTRAKLK